MVGSSYDQKPYRRSMMETWGASVHRSPSEHTEAGRSQAEHPTGSLGIAISEAVEVAAGDPACNYSLGSVLNHVLLHQTVIGQEAIAQLELAGAGMPDVIVGCVGGGSNFGGLVFPFLRAGSDCRIVAAEPAACPTLTRGVYSYDYGDTVGMTPLMPMYTLGHDFVPPPVHAGGLRYHGDAPMVCALVRVRPRRGTRVPPERDLRGGGEVRPQRGHHPRARAGARDPRGDRGGVRRRGEDDPVRPLRPWALRPRRVRRVPRRAASRIPSSPSPISRRRWTSCRRRRLSPDPQAYQAVAKFAMRSTASPSAPPCSSVAVACSARRPSRPPPERSETDAWTSLPVPAARAS